MGLLPGYSVGWHWEEGPLQGLQLGTQIVGPLSSARMGVVPKTTLGETLLGHWVGPRVGSTGPGSWLRGV